MFMRKIREKMVDPVCGEEVDPDTCECKEKFEGELFYFCSLNCLLDFEQNPEGFVGPYV
ncbi:MAG: YHS domain-containing protein [Armatimonadota bacterium]